MCAPGTPSPSPRAALTLSAPGGAAAVTGVPLPRPHSALPGSAKRCYVWRRSVYVYSAGTGGMLTTKQPGFLRTFSLPDAF